MIPLAVSFASLTRDRSRAGIGSQEKRPPTRWILRRGRYPAGLPMNRKGYRSLLGGTSQTLRTSTPSRSHR